MSGKNVSADDEATSYLRYWNGEDLVTRLRKIEGQARGIIGMIEKEQNCSSILYQLSAMSGALREISGIINTCEMISNVLGDLDSMDEAELKRRIVAARKNQKF